MKSLGVKVSEEDLTIRYYRERALPHLIRFPTREVPQAADPLPESLDVWDVGSSLATVDWVESLVRSPYPIPGITLVERIYGSSAGSDRDRQPVDLYLGVDCSGSMTNPRYGLSYPVLAGTVVTLSALRAGAQVMTTLSGEPGSYSSTERFSRSERENLKILTGYLGTGYAFGILRLQETFLDGTKPKRPTHLLVLTDADIFYMLKEVKTGWEIARDAVEVAGGGATLVLDMAGPGRYREDIERLQHLGWEVHLVNSMAGLVDFAGAFSRQKYERQGGGA